MNMKKYALGSLLFALLFSPFLTTALGEAKEPVEQTSERILQSVVQDNFDKYVNGPIVGQGGWFNRANGSPYVVEGTLTQAGKKALFNNNQGADSVITKTGPKSLANGLQTYYIRTKNRASWGTYNLGENVQMGVFQGSWDGPSRATLAFNKDGHVAYEDISLSRYVDFDTYTDNSWTKVEIEWRAVDKTARYRINDRTWTNWIPFTGGTSFTGFNTVGFVTFNLGTGGVYIDSLQ
jgi:hypothetical protein